MLEALLAWKGKGLLCQLQKFLQVQKKEMCFILKQYLRAMSTWKQNLFSPFPKSPKYDG